MRTICIFGDSIADGQAAASGESWAHHFKKFVEERDTGATIVNVSKPGATSRGLLLRIEGLCAEHKPGEIIFSIGLNDTAYSFADHRPIVSREEFEENMEKILLLAATCAQKITVLGILRVDERGSTFSDKKNTVYQYQNSSIKTYNDILKSVAEKNNAHFIDLYDTLSDEELENGYHPNTKGHYKLFEVLARHLA